MTSRTSTSRWRTHALVAGALTIVAIALALLDPDPAMTIVDVAITAVLFAGSGTVAVALAVASQRRATSDSQARLVVGSIVRSLLAATLWLGIVAVVQLAVADEGAPTGVAALWILMFLIVQCIVGATIAIHQLEAVHRAREHALAVEAAAAQARLVALRHQLDPHFLFNALNTIAALVRENATAAEDAVSQLSKLLRHSLETDDTSGTVAQELGVVRALVALARARFEDDLQVDDASDSSDAALAAELLPPFLMQPLVENALEHGMRTARSPVAIRFSIARDSGGIAIEVVNDGHLDPVVGAGSIGLANLRARLALLYPDRHSFTLEQHDGRVHARLRLQRAA